MERWSGVGALERVYVKNVVAPGQTWPILAHRLSTLCRQAEAEVTMRLASADACPQALAL